MKDNRAAVFRWLMRHLKKYEPPFVGKSDFDSRYELCLVNGIEIEGRKNREQKESA